MSALFNPAQLDFHGKEVQQIGDLIFAEALKLPDLASIAQVVTGIKAKEQIGIVGLAGPVGKKQTGCSPASDNVAVTVTQKFWNPAYIFARQEQCWVDLLPSFFAWGLQNGINKSDLGIPEWIAYVTKTFGVAVAKSLYRIAYFGSTTADNVVNSGVINNSYDKALFTAIDGIWAQAFAIVSGDSTKRVTITPAQGTDTYAHQKFNGTDVTNKIAMTTFDAMIDAADQRLIVNNYDNLVFYVTQSLWREYYKELNAYVNVAQAYQEQQAGRTNLEFEGIQIVPMPFWDDNIRTFEDNGTKWNYPHRAILTTKGNIAIGLENENDFTNFDLFQDKRLRMYYADAGYNLDAKIILDYNTVFAY